MNNRFTRLYNGGSKRQNATQSKVKVLKKMTNPRAILLRPKTKKIVFNGVNRNQTLFNNDFAVRTSTSVSRGNHRLARPNLGPTKIPLIKTIEDRSDGVETKGRANITVKHNIYKNMKLNSIGLPLINRSKKEFTIPTRNGSKSEYE
jgi:hypothetical protein